MTKYKEKNIRDLTNTKYNLQDGVQGTSAVQPGERYAMDGYTPPAGVVGKEAVKEMQRWLGGLTVDGIRGSEASAAGGGCSEPEDQ